MQQEIDKAARYHVWTSDEELMANVNVEIKLPDGGQLYTKIGQLAIKKGDALYLDHGRSMGVYTMSGRGYEAEFKFGKVTLHGCPVYLELNQEQAKNVKYVETPREEFDAKTSAQKDRISSQIDELKDVFIFNEMERRAKARKLQVEAEERRKAQVKDAVEKMGQFLKPKKP
jgi:hypothetical protein